ncbi:unnamed protein product [marine sediment metagenome]|uniref:Uncharacterized protein n=1 Tax=marine sediment metagenome TaxID=412755 RepID=X1NBQ2_9ZZZZ
MAESCPKCNSKAEKTKTRGLDTFYKCPNCNFKFRVVELHASKEFANSEKGY